jgi:hypothetical protein
VAYRGFKCRFTPHSSFLPRETRLSFSVGAISTADTSWNSKFFKYFSLASFPIFHHPVVDVFVEIELGLAPAFFDGRY